MSDAAERTVGGATDDADALRERLSQIEQLPLDERAEAFAQVHGQLQSLLEGNDASVTNARTTNASSSEE